MSFSTDLQEILGPDNVTADYPLGESTTFRCGGCCSFLLEPRDGEQLRKVCAFLRESGCPQFVLGRGSNLLVSDAGFPGAVISLRKYFTELSVSGHDMTVSSGVLLRDAAEYAYSAGLSGLEFAHGIPGTVGGAVRMNAGAYGGEIRDIVKSVVMLLRDGTEVSFSGAEMDFSYRHSKAAELSAIVLSAVFSLRHGDPELIRAKMDELSAKRREKQPLQYGSAGSTFKRPEGYFAGALIEGAGMKGFRVGDAGVSEKHAGFVINYGNATASEVCEVIRSVQRSVYQKYGVKLEREVLFLGEF